MRPGPGWERGQGRRRGLGCASPAPLLPCPALPCDRRANRLAHPTCLPACLPACLVTALAAVRCDLRLQAATCGPAPHQRPRQHGGRRRHRPHHARHLRPAGRAERGAACGDRDRGRRGGRHGCGCGGPQGAAGLVQGFAPPGLHACFLLAAKSFAQIPRPLRPSPGLCAHPQASAHIPRPLLSSPGLCAHPQASAHIPCTAKPLGKSPAPPLLAPGPLPSPRYPAGDSPGGSEEADYPMVSALRISEIPRRLRAPPPPPPPPPHTHTPPPAHLPASLLALQHAQRPPTSPGRPPPLLAPTPQAHCAKPPAARILRLTLLTQCSFAACRAG